MNGNYTTATRATMKASTFAFLILRISRIGEISIFLNYMETLVSSSVTALETFLVVLVLFIAPVDVWVASFLALNSLF